jgi:hypothetical protein
MLSKTTESRRVARLAVVEWDLGSDVQAHSDWGDLGHPHWGDLGHHVHLGDHVL